MIGILGADQHGSEQRTQRCVTNYIASIHRAAYERNIKSWVDSSGAWDLIIIDECHHLSDWSGDGSSPQRRMRLARDLVEKRLKPGGRLVLMSATPHLGNYVQLGPDYHSWLVRVAAVFPDSDGGPAAWRKAQALQWAASSPKAGLAYLTRLALRSGFHFDRDAILWDAALALLPYRNLGTSSPVEAVRNLLEKQVEVGQRRRKEEEEEDTMDLEADSVVDRAALERALRGLSG